MSMVLALMIVPAFEMSFCPTEAKADAASYYKSWGKDITEEDFQMMSDKWPDYEPKRCNGWMTEVMNDVYKIPMSMGSWVDGTRRNFLNNSTVKPIKVVAGTYSHIKENVDLIQPGDIVFFNTDKQGKGIWSHVALIGEDHMMWHCTATSPDKKTGKYKSITSWMKDYRHQGEYAAYAEVWRVLSKFSVKSKVNVYHGRYQNKLRVAKYKKGKDIVIHERLIYTADEPIVGKKVALTSTLNKIYSKGAGDSRVYVKGKKITAGEKYGGSTELKYKVKKSGTMHIYYRFKIDDRIKKTSKLTVFTKVKYGSRVLKNYKRAGGNLRTIRFEA